MLHHQVPKLHFATRNALWKPSAAGETLTPLLAEPATVEKMGGLLWEGAAQDSHGFYSHPTLAL